jgi:hypothetical protein
MKTGVFSLILTIFYAFSSVLAADITKWNGTADTEWYNNNGTAFTITTAEQLAGLSKLVNEGNNFEGKKVTLGADIMLNDTTNWKQWDSTTTGLKSWAPIGRYGNSLGWSPFNGTFEGADHVISGIYISAPSNQFGDYQGLFGYIDKSVVKNIKIYASFIKGGNERIGGLVGKSYYGTVINNIFKGAVNGSGEIGGIVGGNEYGTISNCYSEGAMNGGAQIGGIVGRSSGGIIYNNNSASMVTGYASNVGGIIGDSYLDTILNSHFFGKVEGSRNVGGIAGYNAYGKVSNGYSTAFVEGTNSVGGVVGYNDGILENSYFTGTLTGNGEFAGGIAGFNDDFVFNSYSTGTVNGVNMVGGVAGRNDGTLLNSYSVGIVSGISTIGGIVGQNGFYLPPYYIYEGVILNSYFAGELHGELDAGGIVGLNTNSSSIANSYWNKTLNDELNNFGQNNGKIYEMVIGMATEKMQEDSFIATLNAFVDSANAAQTKIVYLSWFSDSFNQGYPAFVYGLADASVTLAENSYIYDGNAKTPAVTVKLGNTTLIENLNYTVSYINNTVVGEATINIVGINNYTGIKTVTFTIKLEETTIVQKPVLISNINILTSAKHLQIQGITKTERVLLLNLKGSILLNRTVQPNENISIAHLPQGIYLLNVGGKTFKFAK